MHLPVDIAAVFKAATDTESAAQTPLSVSVYIDDAAPGDVVGHVRAAFASAGARTRVTVGYVTEEPVLAHEPDDMAVIVAGTSGFIGAQARRLREAGVPVMVATTLPSLVREIAAAAGDPIPEGDIVAPCDAGAGDAGGAPCDAGTAAGAAGAGAGAGAAGDLVEPIVLDTGADGAVEPIALDADAAAALDARMGEWIIAVCRSKKLAFALAFPFVRRPLSLDAVNATSLQNGAVGLVAFIPGADMPIMTLNQAKMLLQIAAAYGQPMSAERVKELAAVVGGAFLFRNIARSAAGVVPVLGWAVRAGVGFAGTQAMGRAAIEYFEAGGDIVGFASVVQRARDEVTDKASKAAATPAGKRAVHAAKNAAGAAYARLRTKG